MRILVDLDGSTNLFDDAFVEYIQAKGYGFDWKHYNDWDIARFITGVESYDHAKDVFKMALDDFEFWENIPPMPYASEVLRYFSFYHDLTIATVPWKMTPQYTGVKLYWLRKHFPFIHEEQVSFSNGNKWDLPGDVIIDDKPEVLERCYGNKITIKPNQPYNKNIKADFSFDCWSQMPDIFDRVETLLKERIS